MCRRAILSIKKIKSVDIFQNVIYNITKINLGGILCKHLI